MIKFKKLYKIKFFKNYFLFILLFIVLATFYYNSVLDKGPLNVHIWRQTDCLSITRNYSEGANFFKPEMNIQLADDKTSGKTAGEFPILYFIVGMIWKLLGESYLSYRLFYLLILFAGLFSFYKSLNILLKNNFWAITISLLLFTSPVYVVYGVSFLTDAPAFSFVLIALYFFLQYKRKNLKKLFLFSILFFALAGLIKVSSLIAFIFLFFILILESLSVKSIGKQKLFHCNLFEWIGFVFVFIIIISWYYYANFYNTLHGFKYTFNDIWPIWLTETYNSEELTHYIKNFTTYVFFSRPVIILLFVIGFINIFLWKKIPVFAYLSNIIIFCGGFLYFILWTPLMGNHDYYFCSLLILFIGFFIPFIWFIKTKYPKIFNGNIIKTIILLFLLYNFIYCLNIVKIKTLAQEGNFRFLCNNELVNNMKSTNKDVKDNWKRFESMKPYLRKIGIKKEDKIISLPDKSFNISLYLLNQKGWSNFSNYNKTDDIEELIQKGAKYLFISNQNTLKEEYLAPFLSEQIGNYKGIEIFKLSNLN